MTPPLDRRTSILILLDSLLDYLPTLRSSTGQLAASGPPVEEIRERCQSCNGTGSEIRNRWIDGISHRVNCDECKGEGTVKAGVVTLIGSGRGMGVHEIDDEIARLERSRRDRMALRDTGDSYGWERERSRLRSSGGYNDLEHALDWLREVAPERCYRCWRYAHGLHDGWSADVWEQFAETLDMLAARLPLRIRTPERSPEHVKSLTDAAMLNVNHEARRSLDRVRIAALAMPCRDTDVYS